MYYWLVQVVLNVFIFGGVVYFHGAVQRMWRVQTLTSAMRYVATQWDVRTPPMPDWSWSCCLQVRYSFPWLHLLCCVFYDNLCFLFPPRASRFDDGSDDCCPNVLSDLHLQQRQHHFHHGSMEDFPITGIRVGTYDCGQVGDVAAEGPACNNIQTSRMFHNL